MKITIVGVWGGFPEKNEATTGYLLQSANHNILIDCGSGVLSKVQNYIELKEIDTIILSHYHGDHSADIVPFQYEALISKNIGTRDKEVEIYGHDLDKEFDSLSFKGGTIGKKIDDKTILNFGDLKVSFKWVKHPVPCLAMRFEENGKVFSFSGDTQWCDEVVEICKDADLFICESALYNEQLGKINGHLTAGEVGKIAQMSNVKKLVLSHFPHFGDLNDLIKEAKEEFKGELYKANTGMVFEL